MPRPVGRVRRTLSVVCVVLSVLTLTATSLGVWAENSFLDTPTFTERAGGLIDRPEVRRSLSAYLAEQANELIDAEDVIADALPDEADILAAPLAGAVDGFVAERVTAVVDSDAFAELWKGAVERAHTAAVALLEGGNVEAAEVTDDGVVINLIPVVNRVLAEISETAPGILGVDVELPTITVDDVPEQARQELADALGVDLDDDFGTFVIYDDGSVKAAQDALDLFQKLVWVFLALSILFAVLALWLSPRRRTILQLSVGVILAMVVIRRLSLLVREDVVGIVKVEANEGAVRVTLDTFLNPLFDGAGWIAAAAGLVAAAALLSGPYGWAVRLRAFVVKLFTGVAGAAGDAARAGLGGDTVGWVAAHRDHLRTAGWVVAAAFLFLVDLSWLELIALGVLLTLYLIGLDRVADWEDEGGSGDDDRTSPTPDEVASG